MQTLKKTWRWLADHPRTHAVLRFLFNCTSHADIDARAVATRLSLVVAVSTVFFVGIAIPFHWKVDWSFREGFPMTMLSVFFLFAIGHFCLKVRDGVGPDPASIALWKVLGYSFIFLAFDDWLRIHETTDRVVHRIFHIHETEWTDHLDDVLVAVYAMVIALFLFRGRRTLVQFREALPFFIPAAILSAGHCILDFVISARSWIREFVPDPDALEATIIWSEVVEESFKIWAEVFIVAASVRCYTLVRDRKKAWAMGTTSVSDMPDASGVSIQPEPARSDLTADV